MKIIVDRCVEQLFTSIMVFKNDNEPVVCFPHNDYCRLDAKAGDRIVVKLKTFGSYTTVTLASFICCSADDVYYVCPTMMCRIWRLLNYAILPYLGLMFLGLGGAIKSDVYSWFCAAFAVLTVLSLVGLKECERFHSMRKRLWRTEVL